MADKDLQLHEKQELQNGAENTRNVPVFIPPVDILESQEGLILLADMPGAPMDRVEIDMNDDRLTIKGSVNIEDGKGSVLLREYGVGDYYRQFTLSSAIDRSKIEATMKDGVLKVILPKAEAAKPRKIAVTAS
jgi:HSP20 family protein